MNSRYKKGALRVTGARPKALWGGLGGVSSLSSSPRRGVLGDRQLERVHKGLREGEKTGFSGENQTTQLRFFIRHCARGREMKVCLVPGRSREFALQRGSPEGARRWKFAHQGLERILAGGFLKRSSAKKIVSPCKRGIPSGSRVHKRSRPR